MKKALNYLDFAIALISGSLDRIDGIIAVK
jgi:hypothetical protein